VRDRLIDILLIISILFGMIVFFKKCSNSQIKTETIYKYDTIKVYVIDTIIKYDTIKIVNRLDFKAFKCESVFIKTENVSQIYDYLKSNSKIDIYKNEMLSMNNLSDNLSNWNFGLGMNYNFESNKYGITLNLKYKNLSFYYDLQNKVFGGTIWIK
jgi:hypothetical protein